MDKIIRFGELSNLNKSSILLEMWEDFEYVAETVFEVRNFSICCGNPSITGIELEGGDLVKVRYISYNTCPDSFSGPDTEYYEEFPVEWLWEEGWYEKERDAVQEKRMADMKQHMEKEELKKVNAARAEKELYLTLKEKYE